MKTAWELAEELNRFAESYDFYEYRDCVDDPTQNIVEIAKMIQNGRTEGIFDWLQAIADDMDEETCNIETAIILLQEMEERRMNMRVLMVEPMKPPYMAEIGKELEDLQKAVGGLIQEVCPWDDPVAIVCNDEGKIDHLPLNRVLRDEEGRAYDIIAGTFFICGIGDEDFTDIPEDLVQKYTDLFRMPEIIF